MLNFCDRKKPFLDFSTKTIAFLGIVFTSSPVMAHIEYDQAFDICIAQPLLQSDRLTPILEEKVSSVHDPSFDGKSIQQLVNAVQYNAGSECAEVLVSHPDIYWAIIKEYYISKENFDSSWVAKDSWCKDDFNGKCIIRETEKFAETISENKQFKGVTPWNQSCMVVLSFDSVPSENKKCIDIVHRKNPERDIAVKCAFEVGYHSMNDGAKIGNLITKCFLREKK